MNPYDENIVSDVISVSSQVINYLEGFNLALTDEDLTVIKSNHDSLGLDVIENVFKILGLDKLEYDRRYFFRKLRFDLSEILRIKEEVEPHLQKLTYRYLLKDHSPDPSKLDSLFNELFEFIQVEEDDKPRFKASLSTIW